MALANKTLLLLIPVALAGCHEPATPAADGDRKQPLVLRDRSIRMVRNASVAFSVTGALDSPAPLKLGMVTAPAHGTLSLSFPEVIYTPATDFVGDDRFSVTVTDGDTTSAASEIRVSVLGPALATLDEGTLRLNIGPRSGKRVYEDTTDGAEELRVHRGATGDEVIIEGFRLQQTFRGVTTIVGDGGKGDNTILLDPDVAVDVELVAGEGKGHLRGGAGRNVLLTSASEGGQVGESLLEGGSGENVLLATGRAKTTLRAGTGRNDLRGGAEEDRLEVRFNGPLQEYYYTDIEYGTFGFPGPELKLDFFADLLPPSPTHNRMAGGAGRDVLVIVGTGDSENIHLRSSTVNGDLWTEVYERRELGTYTVLNTLKVYRRWTFPFDDIEMQRIKRNGSHVEVTSSARYTPIVE